MADRSRSLSHTSTSSPYAEALTPKRGRSRTRGLSTRSKSSVAAASSSFVDKDAMRRQRTLEKHFAKALKTVEACNDTTSSVSSKGLTTLLQTVTVAQVHQPNPAGWSPNASMEEQEVQAMAMNPSLEGTDQTPGSSLGHKQPGPSATFTPTVAGLCQEEEHLPSLSREMCTIIAQTISRGIDEALTQRNIVPPLPKPEPDRRASISQGTPRV